jgi:hypothetical protein
MTGEMPVGVREGTAIAMAKVIVQHRVTDYDRWLTVYIEHGDVRRRHGGTGHTITRAAGDPNNLVVVNEFDTLAGATAFSQDPTLPEAMARAGVDGMPQVWIVNEADTAAY